MPDKPIGVAAQPVVGPGGVLYPPGTVLPAVATMAAQYPNAAAIAAQSGTGQGPQPNLNSVFTPGGSAQTSQPSPSSQGSASQYQPSPVTQGAGAPQTIPGMVNQQFAPMFNPLAVQLFYHSAIAPMMQNLAKSLGEQNAQFANAAMANADKRQMPPGYAAIFGQSIPRQAAAQNDVIASLMGSAMSSPALEQLMGNVNNQRAAMTQMYHQMLAQQYLGLGGGMGGGLSALGLTPQDIGANTQNTPAKSNG